MPVALRLDRSVGRRSDRRLLRVTHPMHPSLPMSHRRSILDLALRIARRIADRETTPEIGEEFCTNPIIKKISFTGSTAVGKHLMKMSSGTVKRLSLGKYARATTIRALRAAS